MLVDDCEAAIDYSAIFDQYRDIHVYGEQFDHDGVINKPVADHNVKELQKEMRKLKRWVQDLEGQMKVNTAPSQRRLGSKHHCSSKPNQITINYYWIIELSPNIN